MDAFFHYLAILDDYYWSYIGFVVVLLCGIYFTFRSRFYQVRTLLSAKSHICDIVRPSNQTDYGIHPFRLYFASVGGMVGLGNLVAVVSVVTIGGPGGLFWMWIACLFGMIVKYAEIYLGITYRVKNQQGGYDGGPMYFLQAAFQGKSFAVLAAFLLCIYGVEVSQFVILTDTFTTIFNLNRYVVIAILLGLIYYTALGGIRRMAIICSYLMPAFMLLYVSFCLWVIYIHREGLGEIISTIIPSAFNGHAAIGGFAGSSFLIAARLGTARAVYSGDIGIGYDATVQSETSIADPKKQATTAVFSLLTDALICTCTCILILATGLWKTTEPLQLSEYVQRALSPHIPYTSLFLTLIFFLAGFTTIIGYFAVGMKAARFISPRFGHVFYLLYGCVAFTIFSFYNQEKVLLLMSLSGGLLVLCNVAGIIKLRNRIHF